MTYSHPSFHPVMPARPGTGRTRRRSLLAAALLAGALLPGASAMAGAGDDGSGDGSDRPALCAAAATGTADSLERSVNLCLAAYTACMREAPGTPDSLERWVDHCEAIALGAA